MSAREELILAGAPWGHHNPDGLLNAFEAEVLREAAEKIRDSQAHLRAVENSPTAQTVWAITAQCADLIDPDKEGSADGDPRVHP